MAEPRGHVPGWVRGGSLVLCLAGLAVSAYLTYEHFAAGTTLACPQTRVVNCQRVTTSAYSDIVGVPVAVLGLVFFLAALALCLPPVWRTGGAALDMVRLGTVSVGMAFVLYLVWAELFPIGAICVWCTAVHLITFVLFAVVLLGQSVRGEPGS